MNIYSCVDGSNIDKIIILFNSVLVNANKNKVDSLKFYLLTDNIPKELPYIPENLKSKLDIRELKLDKVWKEKLDEFNTHFYQASSWCRNNMNFARFLFFIHFPEVNRAIYLDWDMIVLANIFELEDVYNKRDKMVVSKCGINTIFSNIFTSEFKYNTDYNLLYVNPLMKKKIHRSNKIMEFLDLSTHQIHTIEGFNAGFYIVSNTHFEENKMLELLRKLIKIQKKFRCFNFGTQVVMNLMEINKRTFIDKKWNHLPVDNPKGFKIIHWNGNVKPWSSNLPNNRLWYKYCFMVYPELKSKYANNKPKKSKKKSKVNIKRINKNDERLLKYIMSKK